MTLRLGHGAYVITDLVARRTAVAAIIVPVTDDLTFRIATVEHLLGALAVSLGWPGPIGYATSTGLTLYDPDPEPPTTIGDP